MDPWKFSLTSGEQPVVEFTVPYAGHVFIALADRDTRMLVIGGPALLIALLALGELVRAATRRGDASDQGHDPGTVPEQRRPQVAKQPNATPA